MNPAKMDQTAYIKESNFVLAQKGKTFFWSKFLLQKKQATKAVRLYRFCRYVDDVADETLDTVLAHHTLLQIIEDLKLGASHHPILEDAIKLFNESQIEIDIPISLIQGVISDLSQVKLADEKALMVYCYQVAGTVGLMMSKILAIKDDQAFAHAIDLGIAMQLTNICRDVAEDAQMNRRYLPASLVGDIEPYAILKPDPQTQNSIKMAIATLLNNANEYYQSGYHGLCFLPLRARLAIAVASGLYRHIGIRIAKKHYRYWAKRSTVSNKLKIWLTINILARCLVASDFHRYVKPHRADLHEYIKELPYAHAQPN